MRVVVKETAREAALYVAEKIISFVNDSSDPVLGFATGRTQLPIYEALVSAYKSGRVSFKNIRSFNLDEYVGEPQTSPYSYATYMHENFFDPVDMDRSRIHLLDGTAQDLQAEAERYENEIKDSGGIGLQIVSIGRNGHIGFNEPGSSLTSRTRVIRLSDDTRAANRAFFPADREPPNFAITMGIGTILDADMIIMIATGKHKARAIRDFVEGPVTASCPSSALQGHPATLVVLDSEAAEFLQRRQDDQRDRPA